MYHLSLVEVNVDNIDRNFINDFLSREAELVETSVVSYTMKIFQFVHVSIYMKMHTNYIGQPNVMVIMDFQD